MRGAWRAVRGSRRTLAWASVAGVLLATLAAGCGGSEDAEPDPPAPASPGSGQPLADMGGDPVLWLSFDDAGEGPDGAAAYPDGRGGDPTGEVVIANDGSVEEVPGPTGRGSALAFPPSCTADSGCPRALIEVAPDPSLDPGTSPFAYGASVRLDPNQTSIGSNIVQKGRYDMTGGQWKLQIDGLDGEPSCVVRSGSDIVTVHSRVSVADGEWHRVVCRRDAESVSIDVDGTVDGEDVQTGAVENPLPLRIGSPGVGDHDDQFHGSIDDVFLAIGPGPADG